MPESTENSIPRKRETQCPSLPADTSAHAAEIEREALERLGPQGRMQLTFDLIEQLRMIVEAGVRAPS